MFWEATTVVAFVELKLQDQKKKMGYAYILILDVVAK